MAKFKSKQVIVEAVKFTEETRDMVFAWAQEIQMNVTPSTNKNGDLIIIIPTNEGDMICSIGDYIVREPFPTDWRKLYPVKQGIFEKRYTSEKLDNLNFGEAIEALKQGKMISRSGWNGSGMFIFKQVPAHIGLETIPKMQSVPNDVKEHLLTIETELKYTNQMCIVNHEGRVDSWVASSSDTFAEDWYILK